MQLSYSPKSRAEEQTLKSSRSRLLQDVEKLGYFRMLKNEGSTDYCSSEHEGRALSVFGLHCITLLGSMYVHAYTHFTNRSMGR